MDGLSLSDGEARVNLWIRLIIMIIRTWWGKRLGPKDTSVVPSMVCPNDLDIYGHMNNGRYLTLMDLGRSDFLHRTGLETVARQNQWKPLVASVMMKYRKPLTLFQTFEIQTKTLCWEASWIYLEQRFVHKGKEIARGYVRGVMVGPYGSISADQVMKILDPHIETPEIPEFIQNWR